MLYDEFFKNYLKLKLVKTKIIIFKNQRYNESFELISKINIFRILCILFLTIFFGFIRDLTIPIYDWDLDTECTLVADY